VTHEALKDQVSAAILLIRQHRRMPDVRGIVEVRADSDCSSLQHHGRAIANNVNAGKLALQARMTVVLDRLESNPAP
jgi:hypothetical protein